MAGNTEKRDVIITLSSGQALSSIQEMQTHMRKLRAEFRKTTDEGSRNKIAAEMKNINKELTKQYSLTRAANSGWQKVSGTIMKMGGLIAGMMGFQMITDQIGNLIRRGAELSDSMADVQKTTGLTEQQVKELDKSLRKIDTRSSRKELLGLARDAGKLGLNSAAEVAKFVEQADKINVALGEDLGQGALVTIGKLSNIFKTDMLKIASSINTVGASSEASEPALVDFLNRLGGISDTAKLSAPDLIGYGATIDSLGGKVERSATALNTFFIDFVKNTEEFGKTAGFAQGELSKLVGEEGTNAGFIAFLEKLKETNPESDKFLQKLEDMGINGAKGAETFLILANNTERLRQQQDIANKSFEDGTSVIDEFNTKNNNFAANINRIQKALSRAFTSSSFMAAIEGLTENVVNYMKVPTSQKMEEEHTALNVLVGTITDSNTSNEDRLKLIKKLQSEYPDFIGNIDAETVSNEQLVSRLKAVNEQMINRVIIQRKQEELDAQNERTATALEKSIERKTALQTLLIGGMRKYGIELQANQSTEERIALLQETLSEKAIKTGTGKTAQKNAEQRALEQLHTAQTLAAQAEAAYQQRIAEGNDILSEREQLMKDLNIGQDDEPFVGPPEFDYGSLTGGGDSTPESDEAKKNRLQALEETKKLIEELKNVRIAAIDDVEQRELAAAEAAYERQVAEIEATTGNEETKNELIRQLTINHMNEVHEIMAEAHQARLEEEVKRVEAANDSELLTLQLRIDVAQEGSPEELMALQNMLQKQMELELANVQLTEEQKELIRQDFRIRREELDKEFLENQKGWEDMSMEEQLEAVEDHVSKWGDLVKDVMGTVFDFIQMNAEAEMERFDEQQAEEQRLLEERLSKGLISQAQYDGRMLQMQQQRDAKEKAMKRKEFANKKAADTISAIINTAVGVTAGLGAPWPLGIIFAALAGVLGAAEIAMINSQPNPYYAGGRTRVTDSEGYTHNAQMVGSIADGGRYSTPSLGILGERGEELVVPNYILTSPDHADAIGQIELAINRGTANVGKTVSSSSADKTAAATKYTSTTTNTSSNDNANMAAIVAQNNALMQHLIKNGVQGVWEHDKFEKGITDMERIKGRTILSSSGSRNPGERL